MSEFDTALAVMLLKRRGYPRHKIAKLAGVRRQKVDMWVNEGKKAKPEPLEIVKALALKELSKSDFARCIQKVSA